MKTFENFITQENRICILDKIGVKTFRNLWESFINQFENESLISYKSKNLNNLKTLFESHLQCPTR